MWKWLLAVIVPMALCIGAIAWYVTTVGDEPLLQQTTQVKEPSRPDLDKAPPLASDQAQQPEGPEPGWALDCSSGAQDKALQCRLSQRVIMKGAGQLLTQVTFLLPSEKNGNSHINIQLPLGVLVSTGVSIQVDENAPHTHRIRTCNRNGWYVEAPLSPEFLAQLRKGSTLTITFTNLTQKTIALPLSLGGFDEAYAKAQDV